MSSQLPVSTAGIIILPRPDGVDEEESIEDGVDEEDFIEDSVDEEDSIEDVDMLEPEQAPSKWPRKPESQYDLFNPEDSWFDAPPEGFNLTVRVFFLLLLLGARGRLLNLIPFSYYFSFFYFFLFFF